MEPLTLGAKAKGTSAFKKSTWLGTFVYFMEERVEFQILSEASLLHPLMDAKDIPRCLLSSGQLACPRCAGKVGSKSPLKVKPEFLCEGLLPPSVFWGYCSTVHQNSLLFCHLMFRKPSWRG